MPATTIRIEKGRADADELAALTVLLLSRTASAPKATAAAGLAGSAAPATAWTPHVFRAPHSWQR